MSRSFESRAAPERVWEFIARPEQWSRWSPHVRGAKGLGDPEVQSGARGQVILVGGVKLPAEVLAVSRGRSWSWKVGGLVIDHVIETLPDGRLKLEMPVRAANPLFTPVAVAYTPIVDRIAARIIRLAEADPEPGDS